MKKHFLVRVTTVIVCLFLMASFQLRATASGLYALVIPQHDQPVCITVSSPDVRFLDQFDEKRVSQLNLLLRHLSFRVTIDGSASMSEFSVEGEKLFSVVSIVENDTVTDFYSFDSETGFLHRRDAEQEQVPVQRFINEYFLPTNQLTDGLYPVFFALPQQMNEYCKTEKASLNLSGFGKVSKRVTITIPGDVASGHFQDILLQQAESEECRRFLQQIVFSGAQKMILLFSEDNQLLRVSYDGILGISESDLRKVSMVWKCFRTGTVSKDNLVLKTPSVDGVNRNNLEIVRELDQSDPNLQNYEWIIRIDQKNGQDRKKVLFQAGFTDTDRSLSGKAEYTERQNNLSTSVKMIPEMVKENDGEYNGTLEIANYSGKILKSRFVLQMKSEPGERISLQSPVATRIIHLDEPEGKNDGNSLQNKVNQLVIQSILKLPKTDTVFISDGIPEEIWNDITH